MRHDDAPPGCLAEASPGPQAPAAFKDREAPIRAIGVIGFGYVGRATAHALSVVADVAHCDPALPDSLPLPELVAWADAICVCVPTPMGPTGAADLTIVERVVGSLAELRVEGPVLLRSTVPPGTSESLARRYPSLALAFHPEFLRERHHLEDATAPSRVALGWTSTFPDHHRRRVLDLYARRFPTVPCVELDATAAELLKYALNALFGVKVSFANELAELAGSLGVRWEPIRQAMVLDPRVGDGHLAVPGPDGSVGFGGSCLPKDMAGLLAVAGELGIELDVVAAAMEANRRRRPG